MSVMHRLNENWMFQSVACRRTTGVCRRCASAGRLPVLLAALILTVACRLPASGAFAAEAAPTHDEYTLKAVLLYSFGRYVEWPKDAFAGPSAPFVIGILGEDTFGGTLDAIAQKRTIRGRPIVIRRFPTLENYRPPCNILFVARSLSPEQQAEVLAKTQGQPVFVVGESPGFAEQGASANFIMEGDRVRFQLNVDAARRAQLGLDAKILSLGIPIVASRPVSD